MMHGQKNIKMNEYHKGINNKLKLEFYHNEQCIKDHIGCIFLVTDSFSRVEIWYL